MKIILNNSSVFYIDLKGMDPMHKWLPIKNSFVSIKTPTNLVFELMIQRNFYFQTKLVGLI